jgi:pyruvate dehydrogenase E2 component (dihydrolipoamide acetyltransferase)
MDVLMPQLGETVAEGKITRWFKSAGDPINPGDNLFEIETDKVSMEVPSTTQGVLAQIRVRAGEIVPVGAVVAVIADAIGAGPPQHSPKSVQLPQQTLAPAVGHGGPLPARVSGQATFPAAAAPATATAELDPFFEVRTPSRNYGPAKLAGGIAVTPLARRLAAENAIDLSRVKGSGPHGRIVARDIEAARSAQPRASVATVRSGEPIAEEIKSIYQGVAFEEVPLDGMRSAIAKAMIAAKQSIPHFYLTADMEIARLLDLREAANAAAPSRADGNPSYKLSVTDFIVKAWAAALSRVPVANAVWAQDRILRFRHCDIGVAVAVAGGLFAPVIRKAETKPLASISNEMKDLAARARARKLDPCEYQGGSSTISNLGMHGVREFSAIIVPPQSSILAIGAARRQAMEKAGGQVGFTSVLSVTLSCDHRVIDGAIGAQLLAQFKRIIEQPVAMLV